MAASAAEQTRLSLRAAADLSAMQYRVMRISGDFGANLASNSAVCRAIGVLQNDPTSGHGATICVLGESKIVAAGTITAGVPITHDSSGFAIAAVSGAVIIGYALESAVALDVIDAFIGGPNMGTLL